MEMEIFFKLLIASMVLFSCKAESRNAGTVNTLAEGSILVYENNKIIGKIYEPASYKCKSCYAIESRKIGGVRIEVPVSNRIINNKSVLDYDFFIDGVEASESGAIIKYSSTSSSKAYEMEISNSYIVRLLVHGYGVKGVKMGEDGYESFRANLICQSERKIKIDGSIKLDDSYVFEDKDCFECPVKYTVEECITRRNKGVEMDWE